jgi:hypothetical protein
LPGDWNQFIDNVVASRFSGFTVTNGIGYWEGASEIVRILTILGDDGIVWRENVRYVAAVYRDQFGQDCVLIEWSDVRGELV